MHVDTSFLVDLLREKKRSESGPATLFLRNLSNNQPLAASVFVFCELEVGLRVVQHHAPRNREVIETLRKSLRNIYPSEDFPERYASVYAELERQGQRIGVIDTAIAALALAEKAPLITGNVKHFSRIPNLDVLGYR